jgi:hypothetical protein
MPYICGMKVNRPLGIVYKFYLHLREKFNPKPEITDEERFAVEISKKIIKLDDTLLYFTPLSEKRIIKNDNKQIYVVIHQRNVTIINHVYSYSIYIESDELYYSVIDSFNETLEKKREVIELEIKSNIQHSLKTISEKLKF